MEEQSLFSPIGYQLLLSATNREEEEENQTAATPAKRLPNSLGGFLFFFFFLGSLGVLVGLQRAQPPFGAEKSSAGAGRLSKVLGP